MDDRHKRLPADRHRDNEEVEFSHITLCLQSLHPPSPSARQFVLLLPALILAMQPSKKVNPPRGRGRRTLEEREMLSKQEKERNKPRLREVAKYQKRQKRQKKLKANVAKKRAAAMHFGIGANPKFACYRCGIVGYSC